MQRIIVIIVLILIFNISCNSKSGKINSESEIESSSLVKNRFLAVTKIVDGDTFWVDDGTDKCIKIRLIGVDAPESRKTFKKEMGFFGKEAKVYLTNLLKGKMVRLEYDINRIDKYGRTLAYVYLQDRTFVNSELVKNGYAITMTVPPNVKFANEFVRLQREARENKRGLWKE